MIRLYWVPNVALGPFTLGEPFDTVANLASFEKSTGKYDDALALTSYLAFDGTLRLEVRNGLIESVSSEVEFLFGERNIIGMKLTEVESLLAEKADEVDSVSPGDDPVIVDFTKRGMQLVINGERVTSATCY